MGGRQTLFRSLKDIGKSTSPTRITPYVPPSWSTSPMGPPPAGPVLEGVFAIDKPPVISSAQVIRDAQQHFNPSKVFAPWLYREQQRKDHESHNQKQKRRSWKSRQPLQLKMGHGGTLDPMATGVLILGVGTGTKSLNAFLECTKTYECVLLFGAATDSYDTQGKVAVRKPYAHITRAAVEEALQQFRGPIQQRPPIFSALKVNGKKLYEELVLMDWYEGGSHEWNWPDEEAELQDKETLKEMSHLNEKGEDDGVASVKRKSEDDRMASGKRKREDDGVASTERDREDDSTVSAKRRREHDAIVGGAVKAADEPDAKEVRNKDEPVASGALPAEASVDDDSVTASIETAGTTADTTPNAPRCPAPAVRLRMTVTSGFYVRSLCHDLGLALGSAGCMASLVRSRQGDFALGTDDVLPYEDLAKGEEVWGPKVERMLERWRRKGSDDPAVDQKNSKARFVEVEEAVVEDENPSKDDTAKFQDAESKPRERRNTSSGED
ncbi:putative tRNA pseudouridine synthase 4 [Teratosphaeria destructans]|uniref:tRNA pseudouridine(55) synthase n=1 Tax=Teratosphaeria destructans TaxID=418781 RepID=A0A9W7W2J2_9PEZI|nr:putative tRNA pseudouridine synthase 4 [Teratosphaeria destructans]